MARSRAKVKNSQIEYRLSYSDLEGDDTQSHIHLGAEATTGGISVFLCSNLGNGPAGTQACPARTQARSPARSCRPT